MGPRWGSRKGRFDFGWNEMVIFCFVTMAHGTLASIVFEQAGAWFHISGIFILSSTFFPSD